jgi:hypothetical protein
VRTRVIDGRIILRLQLTRVWDISKLLERYEWLAEKVVDDGWNEATVLPQLHVLVYGNKRGV